MSSYVLARVLPEQASQFADLVAGLRSGEDASYVLAELHDFLVALAPAEFTAAVEAADVARLAPFEANYVAAMVEHSAVVRGVAPPRWTGDVPSLAVPYFAAQLRSLRLHLLVASPVAFKRRNLFVDSVVGARV